MENSPVGHRVAQVEAIDKGQKISNAFFLAFNSSKKERQNLYNSALRVLINMSQIRKIKPYFGRGILPILYPQGRIMQIVLYLFLIN